MNKKKVIITIIILILITAAIGTAIFFYNKVKNTPFPDTATGNTAGNLYNGGLFCEYKDKIYFSNPSDKGRLYRMNPDGTGAKLISKDTTSYINIYDDKIFYLRNNSKSSDSVFKNMLYGICVSDLKGDHLSVLHPEITGTVSLCGNYIYYKHYDDETTLTLYKMKRDGSDNHIISDDNIDPSCVYNGNIYFSGISYDHIIYELNTQTDYFSSVYNGNYYMPIYTGSCYYYINLSGGYTLEKYDLTNNMTNILTSGGKVTTYNLYNDTIYFQLEKGDESGIYRMTSDGLNIELVAYGHYKNINCTSKYTYFMKYNNKVDLYRTPTNEAVNVELVTIK